MALGLSTLRRRRGLCASVREAVQHGEAAVEQRGQSGAGRKNSAVVHIRHGHAGIDERQANMNEANRIHLKAGKRGKEVDEELVHVRLP